MRTGREKARVAGARSRHGGRYQEIKEDEIMGLRINSNIEALNAHRNLVGTTIYLGKAMERLSSGLRVNRAADDAAGLAVSEKLISQVRGLNQAVRNAQDAVSLIQTAEGALIESHSILQRMRELAVQSANDTLIDGDRAHLQAEVTQLIAELDRIATDTEFNTKKLLDGTVGTFTFQVGANANQVIGAAIPDSDATALGVNLVDVSTAAGAQAAITTIQGAVDTVSGTRADLGAVQNRLEHTVANVSVAAENLTAANSRIRDADMAYEMMTFMRLQILQQSGTAMLAQANLSQQAVLQLLQ